MTLDEMAAELRIHLEALGPAPRAELLHVLMLPDFERADRIGEFNPELGELGGAAPTTWSDAASEEGGSQWL